MSELISRRRLFVQTVLSLAFFVGAFSAMGVVFHDQLLSLSHTFANLLGGASVPLGFFAVSAFLLPLPDDVFSALGLLGGMSFSSVVALAVLGSITGGAVAYHFGAWLRDTVAYRRLLKHHRTVAEQIIAQYGMAAITVVALTPLPDSPMCWVCGGLGLPFRKFFPLYALGRSLRVTYALWFVRLALGQVGAS